MQKGIIKLNRLLIVLFFMILLLPCCIMCVSAEITDIITLSSITYEDLPIYIGEDFAILHDNIPEFTLWQLKPETFTQFSPLDKYGRTGSGFACIGTETIPSESRSAIGNIKPAGWHTVRYDDLIADKYLYNRCHVIAYMLCGDNATPENLFTGTRYLNATLMVQLENAIFQYIQGTNNHVLYRVSPVYNGTDLVATGVQMEGYSIEDHGQTICFNVFVYNIQPGILIDYGNGDSMREPQHSVLETVPPISIEITPEEQVDDDTLLFSTDVETVKAEEPVRTQITYVLNINTKKFHYPYCSSVNDMKEKNRQDFNGTKEEAIALGYEGCKICNP